MLQQPNFRREDRKEIFIQFSEEKEKRKKREGKGRKRGRVRKDHLRRKERERGGKRENKVFKCWNSLIEGER